MTSPETSVSARSSSRSVWSFPIAASKVPLMDLCLASLIPSTSHPFLGSRFTWQTYAETNDVSLKLMPGQSDLCPTGTVMCSSEQFDDVCWQKFALEDLQLVRKNPTCDCFCSGLPCCKINSMITENPTNEWFKWPSTIEPQAIFASHIACWRPQPRSA